MKKEKSSSTDRNVEHRRGPKDAPVTILEYLDYECPYCAEAEKPIRQVLDAYEGEVAVVVRDYPLTDEHENAALAAVACEAAGRQGKFWEMHDLLFENQDRLDVSTILSLAEDLGLDEGQFREDLTSEDCQAHVKADIRRGDVDGVEGTPTIYVNGIQFTEKPTFHNLSRAVAGLLRAKAA